ncbi:MAG TPA: (S)-ureidoglycine aminohydrolase [Edaphobacter sp.]|jgi:(S)-ureidoglycine aminohydrolase|nr:(S)-ureidoglycine aminohydrolase [Edaphobacter sp.]
MAMHKLGQTRSTNQRDHLLHTPDTFVRTVLPGMDRATAVVHISPAAGAAFTQYTAELEPGGSLGPTSNQRFLYVLEGAADFATNTTFQTLSAGSFAYIPEDTPHTLTGQQATRLAVIEKPYETLASVLPPEVLVGHEDKILSVPLNDDPDLQVRGLLPGSSSFDFAVNTMTYQPGAALSMVEVHIMEHGLLMLEGGGIYRLGDHWYPVTAGDFVWMGPFCPQWFGAIGKGPAKYLIYKDWNRHPLV